MRKKPRYHSLKKLKIRQDWSRWSLYHLSELRPPNTATKTYFQQKWAAKSATRAYHGEVIREKKWKRQFKRSIPAVVPMDFKYLATHDGAEQAAGRGAGADSEDKQRTPLQTPYMQMTYWPIERRLDTAIFRSLFASSVRQARQFVVHGLVKVNGKKMPYPGYLLNPGDMFQVEPESVMFATGAPKVRTSTARRVAKERAAARADARAANPPQIPPSSIKITAPTREEPSPAELKKTLQALMEKVEDALAEDVKAKDKQKLRDFRKTVRSAVSLWKNASPDSVSTLDNQFSFLRTHLSTYMSNAPPPPPVPSTPSDSSLPPADPNSIFSKSDTAKLRAAFDRLKAEADYDSKWNGKDASKPYRTPWRPRDYMSAFAFIPRYLEVNQNICAAVYLRHPVARPGLAEVPTPFHVETGQLAFNWYLRRR
ncbi:alpha-L RNA-binding motif-containing protein [Amniculicola lignicola CBS 123094]|uniref:Alpha-L RNA-binding motif-containing protein n=1 Tax=Amniculicola lignicola CBS 123094 TaxID=1392246 RepID=A0A6A5W000_9PLEO|nr:alpha-L RNA-binding motif-containing protein [Amniculicola lignicola CBS 123094]